jgi:hypothetical protein
MAWSNSSEEGRAEQFRRVSALIAEIYCHKKMVQLARQSGTSIKQGHEIKLALNSPVYLALF